MSERVELLDHGYLELVEAWGSDERIIEAARMSTGKGFMGWGPVCACGQRTIDDPRACPNDNGNGYGGHTFVAGDEKLLRYLWTNKHHTPFEMAGATFEVQAPIMVFREWHRHRTQSYNEMSARYTPLPDVNYIPSLDRLMVGSDSKNKQAGAIKGADSLNPSRAEYFRSTIKDIYRFLEDSYQAALSDGVPKELARLIIPVGRYSRMRASANLRNWLGFLKLRMATDAQYEIRVYAQALCGILQKHFPRTMELFMEGK